MGFYGGDRADLVRAEINGRTPGDPAEKRPRPKRERKDKPQFQAGSGRKQPTASERSSMLAQVWYDLGEQEGFSFPYDVNYFALALQKKIEHDKEIRPFLEQEKFDQVERWVSKMIEIWWNPVDNDGNGGYLTNEINQRNAKDYFLDTDWDDLRDYARSCLRAKYLVEHGRRIPAPLYPEQQEYQQRLQDLRKQHSVDQHLRRLQDEPEPPERTPLDEKARERLRSFADKRRKK